MQWPGSSAPANSRENTQFAMTQVALFLIPLFGITWTLGLLWRPPAASEGMGAFLAHLLPSVWAPTIIALIVTRATEGAGGVRKELRARLRHGHRSAGWLLLAGVVPILAAGAAIFSARAAGDGAPFVPPAALLPAIGLQVVTGAVGEELGWRGFLLPRLARRLGEMGSAWTMALLWALWHVPAFFTPGMPHRTWPVISVLLFIGLFGVFLAFLFNRTGQSVLATMLAHLSLNIMLALGGVRLSSVVFWRILAGIYGALAVLATAMSRRRLSHIDHEPVPS
jgi:uncharacterized protein